jgi:hypothetical protein
MGVFRDDPWLSYPPPQAPPGIGLPVSASGWGHVLSAALTGAALLAACAGAASASFAAGDPARGWYSAGSAFLLLGFYGVALVSARASWVPSHPLGGHAGLFQRAAIYTVLVWLAATHARAAVAVG